MGSGEHTRSGTSGEGKDVEAPAAPLKNVAAVGEAPLETARTEIAPSVEAMNHGAQSAVCTWRPPAVVGKYGIERIVGSGGMGQVYRAWDGDLQRSVAVKFILGIEPDATARQRFMVEARATARIQHPNVLTIYDVKEFDGRPYLVMEFLSGKTLDKITKPVHWSRALEIGVLLSSGLAAAHRSGVLHRDIKPDNAMLTHDGQVKLLDFGLAKVATRLSTPSMVLQSDSVHAPAAPTLRARDQMAAPVLNNDAVLLTDTRAVVGTPGYMAPEGWLGRATTQSDVYSLGALLFDLCAGRAPYGDVPAHALSHAVQTRDAPLLSALVPTVSPTFAAIIARCLSRDPDARYASGMELHEALKELERPVVSGPIVASDPFRAGPSTRGAARSEDPRATARRRSARAPDAIEAPKSMVFREVGSLVISVLSAETPTDEDWYAYVHFCRKKMAQERIGVLALTAGGGPSAKQRMVLRDLLPQVSVLAAVVTDASTVRGMVTALGWFNQGIRGFPLNNGAGLADALKYLRVSGPLATRALMELEAMRGEVGLS
ncbi:Serine/threonine protein kinase [Minicystis rosea]|nr:Serine/threonine protein kinase [Minicystis rosea]